MSWDKSRRDIEVYNVGLAEETDHFQRDCKLGHEDDDQFDGYDQKVGHHAQYSCDRIRCNK